MAEQNPALKRFDVDVCRTGYGFATISVMAANAQEADELALDRAGDYEYSEKNSEYTLVHPAAPAQHHPAPLTPTRRHPLARHGAAMPARPAPRPTRRS